MANKFFTSIKARFFGSPSDTAIDIGVNGDSNARVTIDAGGRITWGSGSEAGDVNLYRDTADVLKTDDTLKAAALFVDSIEVDTTGATLNDLLKFDGTKFSPSGVAGSVDTLDDLSDVTITSPESFQTLVYDGSAWINEYPTTVSLAENAETTTLQVGEVVYLYGGSGNHASVKRADNGSDSTSSKTVGVVARAISSGATGPIVTRGYVNGIDLSTGYTTGDILWLSTSGAFTTTKPTSPEHLVFVGVVVRATSNGIIYVATQNGYELDEIHDVALSSLQSGDFLKWNGTLWVNDAVDLGTDTTGDYVESLVAGTGVTLSNNSGEGATPTVAIGQAVETTSDVTFNTVTLSASPTNSNHAVTKSYVDNVAAGIDWHQAVRLTTAAALPDTPAYSNGTGGVGATLTATAFARLFVDGTNATTGDRVLVKNQATATENGVYVVTEQGNAVDTYWVLTRAIDFDSGPASEIKTGEAVFTTAGAVNANQGFVLTSVGSDTDGAHVLNTDSLTFTQFTGTQAFTAGNGLVQSGNTLNAVGNAGRIVVNADDIDLDTVASTTSAGSDTTSFVSDITVDSYGRVTNKETSTVDLTSTIQKSIVTATGDLIVGASASTPAILSVGADGLYLKTNSGATNGVEWASIPTINNLSDIGDVSSATPSNGDFLKWDGVASTWTPDAIDLGTDTTGDYVQSLVAGTGVTITDNSGEGATPTIAIGQAVGSADSPTFTNLTVNGDLTVSGTTTTVNSTTISVDDPVITLGGDTAPASDDNKDRGVEFRWHNGLEAKTGFFGYDDSTGYFTFIPDATNTSEVFSGTKGTIDVGAVNATNATFTGLVNLPANTTLPERYLSKTASTSLALTDLNYVIEVNSASAVTITVEADAGVNFPLGTAFTFVRVGAGEVTIAAGSGATVNTAIGNRLRVQWSTATLRKRAANTWLLSGDIKV